METMKDIKARFASAKEGEYNALFQHYENDERSGVQKLIQQYHKKLQALEDERVRTESMKKYEHEYEHLGYLCGIDEVGRGPLAGPVVACAVILPKDHSILYLNDSKKLSEKKREALYEEIMERAVATGIGIVGPARIDEINFTSMEGRRIRFTPKNELEVRGERLKSAEFLGRERGVEQVLRALGLRCDAAKYRSKLLKMMAFNPENNIDQFIQDCVLEPGKVDSLKELREQRRQFEHIKEMYENLRSSKAQLETVEQRTSEYERKLRSLCIRELMLQYQELREKEEEKKQTEVQLESLKVKKSRLETRQKELDQRYKEAGERCRIAESNDIFRGVKESIQALERQIEKLSEKKKNRRAIWRP